MKTALIVDDSEYMRALIKMKICNHGCAVVGEAENGVIGVQKYKELKPDFVFMDIMMEELSGLSALKQIVEYDSNAKVVMISSMAHEKHAVEEAKAFGGECIIEGAGFIFTCIAACIVACIVISRLARGFAFARESARDSISIDAITFIHIHGVYLNLLRQFHKALEMIHM